MAGEAPSPATPMPAFFPRTAEMWKAEAAKLSSALQERRTLNDCLRVEVAILFWGPKRKTPSKNGGPTKKSENDIRCKDDGQVIATDSGFCMFLYAFVFLAKLWKADQAFKEVV